jgi:DNA polymerase III gamma/tau subunit
MAGLTVKGEKYKGGDECKVCGITADEFKRLYLESGGSKMGVGGKWFFHERNCDGKASSFQGDDAEADATPASSPASSRASSPAQSPKKRKADVSAKEEPDDREAAKKKPKAQEKKEQAEEQHAAPSVLQHIQAQVEKTHKQLAKRAATLNEELEEMQRQREEHEAELEQVRKGMVMVDEWRKAAAASSEEKKTKD